jgi:hypothetical protein
MTLTPIADRIAVHKRELAIFEERIRAAQLAAQTERAIIAALEPLAAAEVHAAETAAETAAEAATEAVEE